MEKLIKKYCDMNLVVRIIIGFVLGAIFGIFFKNISIIDSLGVLFVGSMKAIAPVLVFLLVCCSVASASDSIGKKFRLVVFLYILNTFLSAIVSVVSNFMFPITVELPSKTADVNSTSVGISDVINNLLTSVVANPIYSISNANYLGILFWAVIIGICLKKVANKVTISVIEDFSEAMSKAVSGIIQFAPIGVFGLVYTSVVKSGVNIFKDYGKLLLLLVGCMLVCALIIEPLIVFTLLKKNPYPLLFKCFKESGITAFFTRSSAANIPINIKLCENLGLSKEFYSVSIPLGATISTNAAAVTISTMTLVLCNTLGVLVDIPSAIILVIMSTIGACGASGVAGGSLLLIPMACSLFGISDNLAMYMVGVGFIIGVIQDAVETAVNSSGGVLLSATAEYWYKKKNIKDLNALKDDSNK